MDSSTCYKCKQKGHFARECPQGSSSNDNREWDIENMKCYKCYLSGHLARDCEEEQSLCYLCREPGHIQQYCPKQYLRFSTILRNCTTRQQVELIKEGLRLLENKTSK